MSHPKANLAATMARRNPVMKHPTTWLTGALVLVTGYYAWQNHRMVKEMKEARSAEVLPKLVPTLRLLAPANAFLRIVNAGPGPAFGVDVEFGLEPGAVPRRWQSPVVASGEANDFWPVGKL